MTSVLLVLCVAGQADTRTSPPDWGQLPPASQSDLYFVLSAESQRWEAMARAGQVRLAIAESNVAIYDRKTRRRYVKLATAAYREERRRRVRGNAAARMRQRKARLGTRGDPLATMARYGGFRPSYSGYGTPSCNSGRMNYMPYRPPYNNTPPYRPAVSRGYLAQQ